MRCAQCRGIESMFDRKTARRDLKRYRGRGPLRTSRILIDALRPHVNGEATLLDIGGGIGAIQHELLRAGADRAIHVDASAAYLDASREEAERQGHADRIEYHHGDFVDTAPDIPAADAVTLDRVLCCYPEVRTLVELSAARARYWYGVVYPRERWWIRTGGAVTNLFLRLRRSPFRIFIHSSCTIDEVARANGLERYFARKTLLRNVVLYARRETLDQGLAVS